jgi:hypothetical protein
MPPKQRTPASTGPSAATSSTPAKASRPTSSSTAGDAQDILQGVWSKYVQKTPQRVKLLDTFMVFLVVVGALQFLYVVLVGNFVRTSLPDCSIGLSKGRYRLLGANIAAAFQRLPLGLQRNGRPVRPHGLAPHADEPGKQGRIWDYIA